MLSKFKSFLIILTALMILYPSLSFASPLSGDYNPDIAFDSMRNRHFVVFHRMEPGDDTNVLGYLLNHDNTMIGDIIEIYADINQQLVPAVAYDSYNHRFLVVWSDDRNTTDKYDVYGQIINGDGTLNGESFPISEPANLGSGSKIYVDLAFNSNLKQFLVVWQDDRNSVDDDIYGQLVNADGTLSGSNFGIATSGDDQRKPSIAYNPTISKYFVAWHDTQTAIDVIGALIGDNGSITLNDINIAVVSGCARDTSIAADTVNGTFLVAFEEDPTGACAMDKFEAKGQLINGDGSLNGSNTTISGENIDEENPDLVFNSTDNNFIAAWTESNNADPNDYPGIYWRSTTAAGVGSGDRTEVLDSEDAEMNVSLAFNSNCNNTAAVMQQTDGVTDYHLMTSIIGSECSSSPDAPELLSPLDGATNVPTDASFKWKASTDPDGDTVVYDFYICENEAMEGCSATEVTGTSTANVGLYLFIFILSAMPFIFFRRRALSVFLMIAFIGIGVLHMSCSSDDSVKHSVTGLNSATQYYWMVIAKDGNGGISPSETWSFTTE